MKLGENKMHPNIRSAATKQLSTDLNHYGYRLQDSPVTSSALPKKTTIPNKTPSEWSQWKSNIVFFVYIFSCTNQMRSHKIKMLWMNRCSWKTNVEAWKGTMRSSQLKKKLFSSSCSVTWTHHLSKEKGWATDSQQQPLFTVQTEAGADEMKLHTCQGWKRSCQVQSLAQPISSACWAAPCQLLASAGLTETPLASPSAERPGSLLSAFSCNDMHMPVWNWGKRRCKTDNRLTLHIYSLNSSTHCCMINKPNISLTWLKINCHWLFLFECSGYSLKVVSLSKRLRFNTFGGDQSTQLNLKNCVSESLIDFTSNLENSPFFFCALNDLMCSNACTTPPPPPPTWNKREATLQGYIGPTVIADGVLC